MQLKSVPANFNYFVLWKLELFQNHQMFEQNSISIKFQPSVLRHIQTHTEKRTGRE